MQVLMVEDEALVRMFGTEVLEEAGFGVIEAGNADEAIEVLKERADVEVLVTDINMPGSMNGLELARLAFERWPAVKLLVVSGKVRPGAGEMPPGAVFVPKPYRPATVVAEIRRLLAS